MTPFFVSLKQLHQEPNSAEASFTSVLEDALLKPGALGPGAALFSPQEKQNQADSSDSSSWQAIIMIAAGRAANAVNPMLHWMHTHLPKTRILGGLTGDYLYLARGGVDTEFFSGEGVLGVAISGSSVCFDYIVSRACMPVTDVFDIRASAGPHINLLSERRPSAQDENAIDLVQRSPVIAVVTGEPHVLLWPFGQP